MPCYCPLANNKLFIPYAVFCCKYYRPLSVTIMAKVASYYIKLI